MQPDGIESADMSQDEEIRDIYRTEAGELLDDLEEALLDLEENTADREQVGRVFRDLHTIKGSGAMCGFDDVASFVHELETVFDQVRKGEAQVTRELVRLCLIARDQIRSMIDTGRDEEVECKILARLRELMGEVPKVECEAARDDPATTRTENRTTGKSITYRIRFRLAPDILAAGVDPLVLLDDIRVLGECRVVAQMDALPSLERMDPVACYVYWDVILTTDRGADAIRSVFILVEDKCDLTIQVIDECGVMDVDTDYKKLGDILVERGDLTQEDLDEVLSAQKRAGEIMREKGLVSPEQVQSALEEQQAVRKSRKQRADIESSASIRVPAAKLDILVDLVGELVIAQARLAQVASDSSNAALLSVTEDMEQLTAELQDNATGIRMLPIGTTFGRFRRLVRDLSSELGKEIELVTNGGDTELDKTVIERLGDPLVHLIRNSIDHGIEDPETREVAGKPRKGTVRLSASHSEGWVVITIEDDGRGMDAEAIRAKAVERGLLDPDADHGEQELYELVLAPGFSTAKTVSNVSGRGVGMDVVKRSVQDLRGAIAIESRKGEGSTVTVRLPLTLAIIDGLQVRIGDASFVIPLDLVEECVEFTKADLERNHGRKIAEVRGKLVPYVEMRNWLGIDGERPGIEQIVIANLDGDGFGFVVDDVVGQIQAVMKSLGKMYEDAQGLAGGTILGDGTVALIIDPMQLHKIAGEEVTTASN